MSNLLQGAVDMLNVGETRLPLYSLLPTKANQKARRFNEAWDEFNRFLFKEYEEGRLSAGDGFFFGMMEQLKTHALEIDEREVWGKGHSSYYNAQNNRACCKVFSVLLLQNFNEL